MTPSTLPDFTVADDAGTLVAAVEDRLAEPPAADPMWTVPKNRREHALATNSAAFIAFQTARKAATAKAGRANLSVVAS